MDADRRSRCGSRRRAAACRRSGVRADDRVEAGAGRGDHGRGRGPEPRTRADDRGVELREYRARPDRRRPRRRTRSTSSAARKSLGVAQGRIQERLRDLYINGEGDSTLEVILGSQSLDDIIARLDAIERVSSQDTRILRTVKQYRKEVETRRENLQEARADQARIVAEQAAQKQSIESPDRRAEPAARVGQGRDRGDAGRGAAAAGRACRAGARARAGRRSSPRRRSRRRRRRTTTAAVIPSLRRRTFRRLATATSSGSRSSTSAIPYVWGGSSPSTGFDCSGFTSYVFAQVGVYASAPRRVAVQLRNAGVRTTSSRPATSSSSAASATSGIYIGGGQFVHAPHTGDVVRISSLAERSARTSAPAASSLTVPRLLVRRRACGSAYSASISAAKCSCTARRRSFSVGVISPCLHREVAREDREALHLLEP